MLSISKTETVLVNGKPIEKLSDEELALLQEEENRVLTLSNNLESDPERLEIVRHHKD